MTSDPNCPATLLTVANEVDATAIVDALADYGVEALASGGYTSGFKAEAPGNVAILVKRADLDRAKQALVEIQQEQGEVDWDNVDVMEGAEEEPSHDIVATQSDWSPVVGRAWWLVGFMGVGIGAVVWLLSRAVRR
jgi:hypothetical protein